MRVYHRRRRLDCDAKTFRGSLYAISMYACVTVSSFLHIDTLFTPSRRLIQRRTSAGHRPICIPRLSSRSGIFPLLLSALPLNESHECIHAVTCTTVSRSSLSSSLEATTNAAQGTRTNFSQILRNTVDSRARMTSSGHGRLRIACRTLRRLCTDL